MWDSPEVSWRVYFSRGGDREVTEYEDKTDAREFFLALRERGIPAALVRVSKSGLKLDSYFHPVGREDLADSLEALTEEDLAAITSLGDTFPTLVRKSRRAAKKDFLGDLDYEDYMGRVDYG